MNVFSVNIAFTHHFLASHLPYKSASGIGYTSKKYLKLQAIRLAIHSVVGEYVDYR